MPGSGPSDEVSEIEKKIQKTIQRVLEVSHIFRNHLFDFKSRLNPCHILTVQHNQNIRTFSRRSQIISFLDNLFSVSSALIKFYETNECKDINNDHGTGIWDDFRYAYKKLEKQHRDVAALCGRSENAREKVGLGASLCVNGTNEFLISEFEEDI